MNPAPNLRDPLGEIERLAKTLWKGGGPTEGTSWTDFIADAEKQLLSGLSGPKRDNRAKITSGKTNAMRPARRPRFPRIASLFHLEEGLDFHESYCFAKLLTWNEFRAAPEGDFGTCDEEEIAELLAILSNEYEESFLLSEGMGSLDKISQERLHLYWMEKLSQWRSEDKPLGYSDRNTLERIKTKLVRSGTVFEIRLKKTPNAVGASFLR